MITHPALETLSGSFSRADLFLVVYYLVDEWMQRRFGSSNAPRAQRGPSAHEFADSEVLTVLLVGELCQCPREARWLRHVRASYAALFPKLPETSRFSRRAERGRELLREFRAAILFWADADLEPERILDTFPLPVCACYRIRQSTLPLPNAAFGRNDSKRIFYYGFRPGLLMTRSGFVIDLILAPGNCNDTKLLAHYLDECRERGQSLAGQVWIMDKGFRNRQLVQWARDRLGLHLCPQQQEEPEALPSYWQATLAQLRKPIEGVLAVLTECFSLEHLAVKTEIGLYRRLQAKATAFSLARYFNRVLGREPLHIARYAV
jgi:hypothetical protein